MLWYYLSIISGLAPLFKGCMGAATTTAVCITAEWTFNQVGMSPCLVAANLESVCNGGDWNIPPLPPGELYAGPTDHQATECTCSTVTYSLVSACALCQQRDSDSWTGWRENCSDHDVSISVYPLTIPSTVRVPAWAYLNVTADDSFDPNAALSVHTAGVPDVGSGNSSIPPPAVEGSSHSDKHIGPIVGGIVGGVVVIILVSCVVYYFCINRRARKDKYNPEKMRFDLAASPAPLNPAFAALLAPPVHQEFKLYDPTDPSTFPTSPAPTLPTYRSSEMPHSMSAQSDNTTPPLPYMGHQGQYTGVPEI